MRVCPKCQFEEPTDSTECARCGVIFAKVRPSRPEPESRQPTNEPTHDEQQTDPWYRRAFVRVNLKTQEDVGPFEVVGRGAVLLLLLIWGVKFIATPISTAEINESFMHVVNLVFHEAGHVIFSLFGDFIGTLGGTLGQLLIPLLCCLTFVFKYGNAFGGAATLWWVGQSCLDVAPYAYDARAQDILLLGGVTGSEVPGYHDWNNILGELGWLQHDHTIGGAFYWLGTLTITVALLWAIAVLYCQLKQFRSVSKLRPF